MTMPTATSPPLGSVQTRPRPGSIAVVVNGRARNAGGDVRDRIAAAFGDRAAALRIDVAERGADLLGIAERHARAGATVVAAGGDGTVSTIASAVVAHGGTLGVLPMGTLNHFAKDVGIPLDPAAAAGTILDGRVTRVDAGDLNGRLFVNNASLGLYPRLVWEREQEQTRGHRKSVAFAIALARTWRRYRRVIVRLTLDGVERVIETPFVFVGNNAYQASGFHLGGRSSLTGGLLSLYVAPASGRLDVIRLAARALIGRLDGDGRFDSWQIQEARVETVRHRVSVALDGELTLMAPPLRFRIRRRALPVLVPSQS